MPALDEDFFELPARSFGNKFGKALRTLLAKRKPDSVSEVCEVVGTLLQMAQTLGINELHKDVIKSLVCLLVKIRNETSRHRFSAATVWSYVCEKWTAVASFVDVEEDKSVEDRVRLWRSEEGLAAALVALDSARTASRSRSRSRQRRRSRSRSRERRRSRSRGKDRHRSSGSRRSRSRSRSPRRRSRSRSRSRQRSSGYSYSTPASGGYSYSAASSGGGRGGSGGARTQAPGPGPRGKQPEFTVGPKGRHFQICFDFNGVEGCQHRLCRFKHWCGTCVEDEAKQQSDLLHSRLHADCPAAKNGNSVTK